MYVCVIGGANIDIISIPFISSKEKDSHPGTVEISAGGVARNIAENLSCLNIPVKLITAIGDDDFGKQIIQDSDQKNIDISHTLQITQEKTSCYNAILDADADLFFSVADMQIVNKITPQYIALKQEIIANSAICVLDTNLSRETIEAIVCNIKGPYYVLDTVSGIKSKKIQGLVGYFDLIKTNSLELFSCVSKSDIASAYKQNPVQKDTIIENKQNTKIFETLGKHMVNQGLGTLVVSMGSKGVWCVSSTKTKFCSSQHLSSQTQNNNFEEHFFILEQEINSYLTQNKTIKNTTGAGDAMCAGIVYALYTGKSLDLAIQYGLVASIVAIRDEKTVASDMSVKTLEKLMEDLV